VPGAERFPGGLRGKTRPEEFKDEQQRLCVERVGNVSSGETSLH
jgi:hypothetical protein